MHNGISKDSIILKLVALRKMSQRELRTLWKELYSLNPPEINNKRWMIKRLAYRIQELAYGVNTKELEERLAGKATEYSYKTKYHKKQRPKFITGTVFTREYRGVEYQVQVLEDGFQYNGCKYRSLSAIANIITNTHCSGPLFFGLIKRKEKNDE